MYQPPAFKNTNPALTRQLIRENPLASLISTDDNGLPTVTHLPLHLDGDDSNPDAPLVFLGHVAKANPHWRILQARPQALVTFLGPHAYMSPAVYPELAQVPTWNYLTAHCTVTATLLEDADAKDALLKKLIGDHEPAYAAQWHGLDAQYTRKMLAGIVGFTLHVTALQCTFKLNEHRPAVHQAMHTRYKAGSAQEQALAVWMERLGMVQ